MPSYLIRKLRDHRVRTIVKIALGVLGALGAIASIIGIFMTDQAKQDALAVFDIPARYLPTVLTLTFSAIVIFLGVLLLEFWNQIRKFSKMLFGINQLSGSRIDVHRRLLNLPANVDSVNNSADLGEILSGFLNNIKDVFTAYTGDPCSVCIKVFVSDAQEQAGSEHEQTIRTLARDSVSRNERRYIDDKIRTYPYNENTAFEEVINSSDRWPCFLSNDITSLENKGKYKTVNTDWKHHYNAAMVVAVSEFDNPSLGKSFGFICIDNLSGGFDKRFCLPMLLSIGKDLYQFFIIFARVKEDLSEQTG